MGGTWTAVSDFSAAIGLAVISLTVVSHRPANRFDLDVVAGRSQCSGLSGGMHVMHMRVSRMHALLRELAWLVVSFCCAPIRGGNHYHESS